MEEVLEELLKRYFPLDGIDDVPVGVHGGDVIQAVFDATGEECGKILWESKRTRSWSDAWLPKLREDQRAAKAQIAILVTAELPKGVCAFALIDGVWVTKWEHLIGLAIALRGGLLEVGRARRSMKGQHSKLDYLYQYLIGQDFQQRVEGIVDSFTAMKDDLVKERRATHKQWARREKQIDRAMVNTSTLYGDLSGIIGAQLPEIDRLELADVPAEAAETVDSVPWA